MGNLSYANREDFKKYLAQNSVNKIDLPSEISEMGIKPLLSYGAGNVTYSDNVSHHIIEKYDSLIVDSEVWVDSINGNDSNNGSRVAPVKTLANAVKVKAGSYVNVLSGEYSIFDFRQTDAQGGTLKIIKAIGKCTIKENTDDLSSLTFVQDGTYTNCYVADTNASNKNILSVLDSSLTDDYGLPLDLTKASSVADLNSFTDNVGFYFDAGNNKIYINYFQDVNNIKSNLKAIVSDASSRIFQYGTKMLMIGEWHLEGVFFFPIPYNGTQSELYLDLINTDKPNITNTYDHGLNPLGAITMAQNVWIHSSIGKDNFHYTDDSGFKCTALEIDCKSTNSGSKLGYPLANGTNNASSTHGSSDIVRINGFYAKSWGPQIADTGSGYSYNYGIKIDDAQDVGNQSIGIFTDGVKMYLEDCVSIGNYLYDLQAVNGGSFELKNITYNTIN